MTAVATAAPVQRAAVLATIEKVRRRGGSSRALGIRASRGLESLSLIHISEPTRPY